MRKITLSAAGRMIDAARQRAVAEKTTVNAEFRKWLTAYARPYQAARAMDTVRKLPAKWATGGVEFTRDELNER